MNKEKKETTINNIKIVQTKDKSFTLFNSIYNDFYHSREGALKEALYSFLYPIKDFLKKQNNFFILEIGFGLGYNALVFDYFLRKNQKNFSYLGIEKDKELFDFLLKNCKKIRIKNYCKFLQLYKTKILFEDATKVNYSSLLTKIGNKWKILIHDGFTPSKNKELWTYEFLSKFKDFNFIITYTNNPKVRASFFLLDFFVFPTKRFKNSGTIAVKDLEHINYLNIKRYSLKELVLLFSNYAKPYNFLFKKDFPFIVKGGKIKIRDYSFLRELKEIKENNLICELKRKIKEFWLN
jgi:tRNA U34 5-methylaminomethyl-2-thiouridine-forming methyltransferase MnmC